jgi:dolichol-phosphate mannosyltransferase
MTILQIVFILASLVFIFFSIDLRKRKKISFLSFIIIVLGAVFILISSFNIQLLNSFTQKLGIARGAELIVYCAVIFLGLAYMNLMNSSQKDQQELSRLVSQLAINEAFQRVKSQLEHWKNADEKDSFLIHMRVYNEEHTLETCIEEIIQQGFRKLIFVNDGSRDASLAILERQKAKHPDCLFIICSHTINRGGGSANKTGFSFIQQHFDFLKITHIITFDPDGQMDIRDTETFFEAMRKHPKADIFVGSRFVKGGTSENIPPMRKVILWISRLVTRLFYGVKVSDPHNGYRIYTLETMKKIHLTSDGMHYANEVNEHIKQLKLQYVEVPVHITYTSYSL